jgi:hypothetical protein
VTTAQLYRKMIKEHGLAFCWACGRDSGERPENWFAPWFIERAHIVRSPRKEDRRLVTLLCGLCHRAGVHGERIVTMSRAIDWPRLEVAHLLALKLLRDPEYFDLPFLQRYSVQKLPAPRDLPDCYVQEYLMRHPA